MTLYEVQPFTTFGHQDAVGPVLARADDLSPVTKLPAGGVADRSDPAMKPHWEEDNRRAVSRSVALLVISLVVGLAGLVVVTNPVLAALPVIAATWSVRCWRRQRADAVDAEIVSRNLAAVSALADQAYGRDEEATG